MSHRANEEQSFTPPPKQLEKHLSAYSASESEKGGEELAHPDLFPTPDIFAMPYARLPPNAPAIVAAEKNSAMRYPHSCRRYHVVM